MLLGRLLKGTVLQRSEIEELVYSYHPWRKDLWIDHLAALWVMRIKRLFKQMQKTLTTPD
jgi:hypothetical protein